MNNVQKIIISECDKYVSVTVVGKTEQPLSWETLQEVKDEHYPYLDFIEVYPKCTEIINKANERHLIHRKGFVVPKLEDLERPSKTRIFRLK